MDPKFRTVPEALWRTIAPLLPPERPKPKGGRPRVPDRVVLAGILYQLRTGCQWKALPSEFGSGSTCHLRLQQWRQAGVFTDIFVALLERNDKRRGIAWKWTALDGFIVKAPKGGDLTGANPTDRGKRGTKRHILTDRRGVPLAATLSAANVHDKWLLAATLDAVVIRAPRGPRRPKHLCLDKGYDFLDCEAAVRQRRIVPHIRRKGEPPLIGRVHGRPRRWVVERTGSWQNHFRALLIRWERKAENYLALLHLACGLIAFQQAR